MAMEVGRSLECKLVEIFDQPPLPPSPEALEKDPNAEPIDVDGKKGQTLAWVEDSKKYVVETFDGELVAIAEDHLREYVPPPLAEGGFDLAFPGSDERSDEFQSDIANALLENKYCVVQMTLKQADRKAITRQLQDLDKWVRFMPEFEPVYMGQRPDGKRAQWFTDHSKENIDEMYALGFGNEADENGNAPGLESCDDHLKNLALCVCNIAPYLGFNGICRSNAMVHMNCVNSEEEMGLLEDARSQAVGAGVIQGHLAFFHRRKVCMIYFVNGSGGTLTLHPANRGDEDITISCQEGQAVIFRHDLMDYTYLPEGKQIAMQAWVFREQQSGECSLSQPELLAYVDLIEEIPRGPVYGNNGRSVDNMAFSLRIPGMVSSPEGYWTALCCGFDGVVRIPLQRWDHDFYWQPEPEIAQATGKAYTFHLGLTDNDTQMFCFDNEFFGISEEHVNMIDPVARNQLEVGYDCMYRAGWTKPLLKGTSMVIVAGAATGEFETHQMNGWRMAINSEMKTCLNMGCTAARLQFCLGMTGRCATVETACSSSLTAIALVHTHMRPDQAGQMKLQQKQEKYGMGLGANGHFDPFYMTGLCGAKMLSIQGRCFTFDQSGDGFTRGEGQAAMYFKQSEGEDLARLSMVCGTCMNQDGRSASLTAPHGPSQQECIRHSLREANIPPLQIQMQELHGTGTALGDPIEVGALRATMMMYQGDVREHPLVKTSSKSNLGHTELCAGICGIIKAVLMSIYCDACPNNHIRLLNPHIDSNAYPVYFVTESVDQGKNSGYGGVSSFGFGGSNARGDIWARALAGPRNTDPGTMHAVLNANRIFIWGEVCKQAKPRNHAMLQLETALDNLEEYEDAYMVGEQPTDEDELFVVGSFNGWTTPEKMTYVEEFGSYIFAMPLGEACVEQFQICMNKNEYFKIFPAAKFASGQDTIVLGPGIAPVGNQWVIDGRPQGLPQGTIYHISLQWELETRRKTVTWEPSLDEYMTELASQIDPFRHRYCVLGSWSGFKPIEMLPARGEKPGTFETAVRVGIHRKEEFRFQRDADRLQTIYPARQRESEANTAPTWAWTQAGIKAIAHDAAKYGHPQVGSAFTPDHLAIACKGDLKIDTVAVPGSKAWNDQSKIFESMKVGGTSSVDTSGKDGPLDLEGLDRLGLISNSGSESVPACGPDHLGEDKNWHVTGTMGESIKIMLRVWDGEITVTTVNSRTGIRTWTNQQAALRRKYFVTATWNNWGFTAMQAEGTDIHWLKVQMPRSQMVAFQIAVDEDKAQAIHPDMALTDQLMSPAMGPDAKGDGLFWGMGVESGAVIEIKLDLSQEDRRKVVTWTYS